MATQQTDTSDTAAGQFAPSLPPQLAAPSRFDQMCARMNGTVTILGDIVNSDPELWDDEK